jgi:hypothetical protein
MADINETIDNEIARGDMTTVTEQKKEKYVPVYQVIGDTKVPVSKAHGKLWNSRRQQALSARRSNDLVKAWDEAIRYYRNDQIAHRTDDTDGGDYSGNETGAMKMHRRFSETENVVFANVSALVPTLYAKNPSAEFTANDPKDNEIGVMLEKLTNRILSKKSHPGVNLKPKVRKSVVMCTLTNVAYCEVGYTFREQSSEQAMQDLATLSDELTKAKSPEKVREVEGKIEALEQAVDVLRPAGPWVKFRRPHDVIWDTDGEDDDNMDSKWCMIADFISTSYLNAKFTEMKGQTRRSLYKPTHVIKAGESGESGHNIAENEINQYSLFQDDEGKKQNAQAFGYSDDDAYKSAQRTKCWWVWDKVTRRVLLYADNDWSFPVWVWDDPYKLQGFFPIYKLQFNTDPENTTGKGEVTYYLDQQDAINTINSELKQARQWARRNLFYDKNKISKDEVEKYLKGDEDVAVGVDVPEGMNLKDFVTSVVPPSMQFIQLFDKGPILEAIDRVSSVQPVMRGTEFKTNTTNQAINQYNSTQQTRTDEKIDAVEDFIGNIAWAIAQMTLQFMDKSQVEMLIGKSNSVSWRNMSANEVAASIQMTVVGGSTQKQTSESKKQQAMQMGQVLGQFVNAAPIPVMLTMMKTFRAAFNDVIPDEEWGAIMDSIQQQAQQPSAPAGGGEGGSGEEAPTQNTSPQGGAGADPIAALEQVVDAMPPEAKQALGAAMAKGVPVREALERIVGAMQQGNAPVQ